MKKLLLHNYLLLTVSFFYLHAPSQNQEDYNLYISGGVHCGLINLTGVKEMPYNIHADKLISGSNVLVGAGYSCDFLKYNPFFFSDGAPSIRQNFRLRICQLRDDPEKRFVTYQGLAVGVSFWKKTGAPSMDQYRPIKNFNGIPTIQYLVGMRYMINESLFWQAEGAIGAPYSLETGVGVKF
jgi:hypothetical protein